MGAVAIHKLDTSGGVFLPGDPITGLPEGEMDFLRRLGAVTGGQEQAPSDAPASYTVRDKGRGWFVIMADDREVTKSLREDDLDGFNDMTAEEQSAFVAENAKD